MITPASRIGIRAGFSAGASRLARRSTALVALLGAALAITSGLIEARVMPVEATDRALGSTFGWVVPLVTFALIGQLTGRGNLADRAFRVARFGLARRDVALGLIGAGALVSAAFGALSALLTVLAAGEGSVLQIAGDALTTAGIGALSAVAYAAWFSLGATFGARGGGRFVPLALDFLLQGSAGPVALVLPRVHASHLLGAAATIDISPRWSSLALAGGSVLLMLFASLRAGE